jgi:hypothetical protein
MFDRRAHGEDRFVILFAVAAIATGLVAGLAAPAQAQEETPSVEGVVHINGEPAWAGIVITIEHLTTGETCGTTTTGDDGNYKLSLEAPCEEGAEAVVLLQQVQARKASDQNVIIGMPSESVTFIALFALTPSELDELPPPPTLVEEEGAAGVALVQKTSSVFDEVELLLIFLLVAGAVLLALMAGALLRMANRRYTFLTETFAEIDNESQDQMKSWVDAIKAEGDMQKDRFKVFRWMVEGLVMSFVVIALIALGAAGKVDAQGIVSVLAAMVGYAAGRGTA